MRRIDIITSIKKIQNAIADSKIDAVIGEIVRKDDKLNVESMLESMTTYSYYYKNFTDNEKKIISIFQLDGLENSKTWVNILLPNNTSTERRSNFFKYFSGLNFLNDYLDKIIELFKQDNIDYIQRSNQIVSNYSIQNQSEILTVILPEKDTQVSSNPERLIKVLSSVNSFYKVLSEITGHEDNGDG
ncbi:hypothetical protein [Spirosoma areae]